MNPLVAPTVLGQSALDAGNKNPGGMSSSLNARLTAGKVRFGHRQTFLSRQDMSESYECCTWFKEHCRFDVEESRFFVSLDSVGSDPIAYCAGCGKKTPL